MYVHASACSLVAVAGKFSQLFSTPVLRRARKKVRESSGCPIARYASPPSPPRLLAQRFDFRKDLPARRGVIFGPSKLNNIILSKQDEYLPRPFSTTQKLTPPARGNYPAVWSATPHKLASMSAFNSRSPRNCMHVGPYA